MSRSTAAAALVCAVMALAGSVADAKPLRQQNQNTCDENSGRCIQSFSAVSRPRASSFDGDAQIVAHPAGCPRRAFCGCGVSVKVFGRPIRDLFLAANWVRKFPRTAPASGMVAARSGHVMFIISYHGGNSALVYDPNSGGHKTRIHTRSLAGYRIVDPHGGRVALR